MDGRVFGVDTYTVIQIAAQIFSIVILIAIIVFFVLVFRALIKYNKSKDVRREKTVIRQSLGETLKEHRIGCKMTQEFVAEALGVSRQAVSKWENGASDPSTSNLIAIAKLYGVSAEELLRGVGE